MNIIRYQKITEPSYGLLEGDKIIDLIGDPFVKIARGKSIPLSAAPLLAPCQPGKIIGLTRNYSDRLRELGQEPSPLPLIFLKPPSSVIGPEQTIHLPPQAHQVEYGAELAAVIGKTAHHVPPEDALQYVLGYTCANDVIAADLYQADGLPGRATSFDTFCALGPCIAADLNPADVLITCKINGETRQMTSTHDMLFTVPQIVAFVSSIMTLLPGDVLLTGTPAGAGPLKDGDVVEIDIEGIGLLRNPAQRDEG